MAETPTPPTYEVIVHLKGENEPRIFSDAIEWSLGETILSVVQGDRVYVFPFADLQEWNVPYIPQPVEGDGEG